MQCHRVGASPVSGGVINTSIIIAKQASTQPINCVGAIFISQICPEWLRAGKFSEISCEIYPKTLTIHTGNADHLRHGFDARSATMGARICQLSIALPIRPA